jgi:hypothetical protein
MSSGALSTQRRRLLSLVDRRIRLKCPILLSAILSILGSSCRDRDAPLASHPVTTPDLQPESFGIPADLAAEYGLFPASARQYKIWRTFSGEQAVADLERALGVKLPEEFVADCRAHDGGVLTGVLFFNTEKARGYSTHQFLGFGEPHPIAGPFNDDLISECLRKHSPLFDSGLSGFVPFAIANGPVDNPEDFGKFALAFSKVDTSVHLVDLRSGQHTPVADSYSSFLAKAACLGMD